MSDIAKAGNFEAVDERSDHDNFRTGIYEREYDGLLIARCNQNGNYPHHVQAILNGLNGKRVSMDEITRLTKALDAAHTQIAELEAGGWRPTHRHVKRGTEYEHIGTARLQTDEPLTDMAYVEVYLGRDGDLWARRQSEFHDGRFEPAPSTIRKIDNG